MARDGFRQRFRGAPLVLRLSFSLALCLGLALAAEGAAWAILRFGLGVGEDARPVYFQRLSGWRVFENTPGVALEPGIGGPAPVPDARGLLSRAPYALEKPAGTLRVILDGGSAAAGAGQFPGLGYNHIKAWPRGTYTFAQSIGGKLEDALARALPGRRVEVIVAAHNFKVALQSYVHYLTALASLSPDYLIHVDGNNDQLALLDVAAPGDPWATWERRWKDNFVRLHDPQAPSRWNLERLATHVAQRIEAGRDKPPPPVDAFPRATDEQLRPEYDRVKAALYLRPAAAWLEALAQHLAAASVDGTRVIFALQPLLTRRRNKALSQAEATWELMIRPRAQGDTPEALYAWMLNRWLWDEHLTHELRRRVEARGHVYLDLADAIAPLPASVELYTDHVHLTPEGNDAVVAALASAVLTDLRRPRGPR